jgi:aquaporin Z
VAVRALLAEGVGTAVLVLGGVGAAVLAGPSIGVVGVSLAFGFTLLVLAALLGPVSGAHVNPAVTIGMALSGVLPRRDVAGYLGAQVVGGLVGAAILFVIANGLPGFEAASGFGANGYEALSPTGASLVAVLLAEVVFTGLFVLAVLSTTRPSFPAGLAPVVAGLSLALVHLVTIPVSNTSVNPARSIAAAVFAGGDALAQVWVFVVAPLVGAVAAAGLWRVFGEAPLPVDPSPHPDPALT